MIEYVVERLPVEEMTAAELSSLDAVRRAGHMDAMATERLRLSKIADTLEDAIYEAKALVLDDPTPEAKKALLDAKRVEAKIKQRIAALKHVGQTFQTLIRTVP